jgi:DNA-directed RNA polymerase specialized sigma24 family protein
MKPSPPLLLVHRQDLALARDCDVLAFGRIIEATQRMVTALTLAALRDRRASESVATGVYVETFGELADIVDVDSLLVALRQRARSSSAAFERARTTQRAAEPSSLLRAVEEEERLLVAHAFDGVPEPLREILAVYYREDGAHPRVAALLGLPTDRLAALLDRARGFRCEVLASFGQIARRTSPGPDFTSGVVHRVRERAARSAKPTPPALRRMAMALRLLGPA